MKHSLILATIAAATLLTACGGKHEAAKAGAAGSAQKANADIMSEPSHTQLMYENLENGPWYGDCGDSSVFSIVTENSQRTIVEFNNSVMKVSAVTYNLADCKGEVLENKTLANVSYSLKPSFSMYSDVPSFIISQDVYAPSNVHMDGALKVAGKYSVSIDGDKMILNAVLKNKKISQETLVLTRKQVLGTERF